MKKKTIFIISGALIAVAVLVAVFFILQPKPQTVVSDDGSARLEIPKGALPEGVKASDIVLKKHESEASENEYARYELLPEGTVFKKPVTFKTEIPFGAERGIPMVVLESDEQIEVLAEPDITLQEEVALISVEVPHFSVLVIREGPFIAAITPAEIKKNVGESFFIETTVSVKDRDEFIRGLWQVSLIGREESDFPGLSSFKRRAFLKPPAYIEALYDHGTDILAPEKNSVDRQEFEDFHFHSVEFTCAKPGANMIRFYVYLRVSIDEEYKLEGGEWQRTESNFPIRFMAVEKLIPFECVGEEPDKEAAIGQDDGEEEGVMPDGDDIIDPELDIPLEEYDKYSKPETAKDGEGGESANVIPLPEGPFCGDGVLEAGEEKTCPFYDDPKHPVCKTGGKWYPLGAYCGDSRVCGADGFCRGEYAKFLGQENSVDVRPLFASPGEELTVRIHAPGHGGRYTSAAFLVRVGPDGNDRYIMNFCGGGCSGSLGYVKNQYWEGVTGGVLPSIDRVGNYDDYTFETKFSVLVPGEYKVVVLSEFNKRFESISFVITK